MGQATCECGWLWLGVTTLSLDALTAKVERMSHEPLFRCGPDVQILADKMLGEVVEFGSSSLLHGRLAMKSSRSAVEESLKQASMAASGYVSMPAGENLSGAMPVVASRVAIPEKAGLVDPCELLPGWQRDVVENLESLRKPEHLWDPVPQACHRVEPSEEAGLAKRLLASGMVKLVPEKELPKDSLGFFLSGGLFCVPKNEVEDRLIFDRRPEKLDYEQSGMGSFAGWCLLHQDAAQT